MNQNQKTVKSQGQAKKSKTAKRSKGGYDIQYLRTAENKIKAAKRVLRRRNYWASVEGKDRKAEKMGGKTSSRKFMRQGKKRQKIGL